jgi:hypothetical protein
VCYRGRCLAVRQGPPTPLDFRPGSSRIQRVRHHQATSIADKLRETPFQPWTRETLMPANHLRWSNPEWSGEAYALQFTHLISDQPRVGWRRGGGGVPAWQKVRLGLSVGILARPAWEEFPQIS